MSEALCVVQGPNPSSCQVPASGGDGKAGRCAAPPCGADCRAVLEAKLASIFRLAQHSLLFAAMDMTADELASAMRGGGSPFVIKTNFSEADEKLRLENDQKERSLRLRSLRERKASS